MSSPSQSEIKANEFLNVAKTIIPAEKYADFINNIESNNFNKILSLSNIEEKFGDFSNSSHYTDEQTKKMILENMERFITYFYDFTDEETKKIIIKKMKDEIEYPQNNYLDKAKNLYDKLSYSEKVLLKILTMENQKTYEERNQTQRGEPKPGEMTTEMQEFVEVYKKLNAEDIREFHWIGHHRVDWSEYMPGFIRGTEIEQKLIEQQRILKFKQIYDHLSDSDKARVINAGWLEETIPEVSISEKIDFLIKDLIEMPANLKIEIYESRLKNIDASFIVNNNRLSHVENRTAQKFLKKLSGLDNTEKNILVFSILQEPRKKELNNPELGSLINEYYALNSVQRHAIMKEVNEETKALEQIKKVEQFSNYQGSFLDKIKFKLLSNKEISREVFEKVSHFVGNTDIKIHFDKFFTSDLLIESGNLAAVEFLTKNNKNYKKPEILARMIKISEIQKQNEISTYLNNNFGQIVENDNRTEFAIPDKNKILGKFKTNEAKDAAVSQNIKIK